MTEEPFLCSELHYTQNYHNNRDVWLQNAEQEQGERAARKLSISRLQDNSSGKL